MSGRKAHSVSASSSSSEEDSKLSDERKHGRRAHSASASSSSSKDSNLSGERRRGRKAYSVSASSSSSEENSNSSDGRRRGQRARSASASSSSSKASSEGGRGQRARSASSSSSSSEDSDERRRHRRNSDEGESHDSKPKNLKMPELLDPEHFEDFTGLPLLQAGDIGKDDEFWIIQCPKKMDASLLLNKKINLGGNSKIKAELDNGRAIKFEAYSEPVSQSLMTCLVQGPSRLQAVQLPIQGKVLVTDKVEPPEIDYEYFINLKTKPDKIPQPTNLKVRHPLFGSEYAAYLSTSPYKSKKKKKERKSDISTMSMDTPKKKKKRSGEEEEEQFVTPKSKKIKKEEMTFLPTETSTQLPGSKKKKRKYEEDSEVLDTPPHKKKIKQEILSPSRTYQEETMDDTLSTSSSKKKKHKKSKHYDE